MCWPGLSPSLLGGGDDLVGGQEEAVEAGVAQLHAGVRCHHRDEGPLPGGEGNGRLAMGPVRRAPAGDVEEAGDAPRLGATVKTTGHQLHQITSYVLPCTAVSAAEPFMARAYLHRKGG